MLEGFTRYNFKEMGGYVSCEPPEKVPVGSASVARNVKFLPNSVRLRDGLTQVWQLPEEFLPILAFTAPCPTDMPVLDIAYSYTFTVENGTAPYLWEIISGSLPPGLELDEDTGEISGTPTTAGTYPYTLQVTDTSIPTRQVAQTSCTFEIAVAPTSFRPTIWEVDPAVGEPYAHNSIIYDGALAIDNDAPVGESITYARLWGRATSLFSNYANEFLHGFPEPDPMRVLSGATIYVRASRTCTGSGTPIAFIEVYNGKNTSEFYTGGVGYLLNTFDPTVVLQNLSCPYTAVEFNALFPGGAADIWIRMAQWHTLSQGEFDSNLLVYDCWITYTYV